MTIQKVIARAWTDADYKAKLLTILLPPWLKPV